MSRGKPFLSNNDWRSIESRIDGQKIRSDSKAKQNLRFEDLVNNRSNTRPRVAICGCPTTAPAPVREPCRRLWLCSGRKKLSKLPGASVAFDRTSSHENLCGSGWPTSSRYDRRDPNPLVFNTHLARFQARTVIGRGTSQMRASQKKALELQALQHRLVGWLEAVEICKRGHKNGEEDGAVAPRDGH